LNREALAGSRSVDDQGVVGIQLTRLVVQVSGLFDLRRIRVRFLADTGSPRSSKEAADGTNESVDQRLVGERRAPMLAATDSAPKIAAEIARPSPTVAIATIRLADRRAAGRRFAIQSRSTGRLGRRDANPDRREGQEQIRSSGASS